VPTATELRELDDDELEGRLAEYRRELLNLRFQIATGQLDNVARISTVRKDLARVLTILRDREIALAEGRDAGPVVSPRTARRRAGEAGEAEDVQERPRGRRTSRRAEAEAEAEAADEVPVDEVDELDQTGGSEVVDEVDDDVDEEDR